MDYRKAFFVEPGQTLVLKNIDPAATPGCESKEASAAAIEACGKRLTHQQNLLNAGASRSLLIVLQGSDAAGKDGAIRRAFTFFNPQGVIVTSFKEPSTNERAHDFLWRVHPHAPARGFIAIFNRSHYEDVLIARVNKQIDKKSVATRFADIRAFEALLAQNNTLILKFFLHISREEQLARFEKRLVDPERNWKISDADYSERPLWDAYVKAYEDALSSTSAPDAPWYVIPSNRKWFRDLALAQIVVDSLEDLGMAFPASTVDLAAIRRKYHEAVRDQQAAK